MDSKKIKARRYNNSSSSNYHYIVVVFCLLLVVSSEQLLLAQGDPSVMMTNQINSKAGMIIDAVKTLFSFPTSPIRWPFVLKDAYKYGRSQPNIDFRSGGEEGTGEKVKEAVLKTMDESKATVEGSATSAAKLTEDAVDKTVNKLKKTFSKHEPEL